LSLARRRQRRLGYLAAPHHPRHEIDLRSLHFGRTVLDRLNHVAALSTLGDIQLVALTDSPGTQDTGLHSGEKGTASAWLGLATRRLTCSRLPATAGSRRFTLGSDCKKNRQTLRIRPFCSKKNPAEAGLFFHSVSSYAQAVLRRRRAMPMPSRPMPSNAMLPGSGTWNTALKSPLMVWVPVRRKLSKSPSTLTRI
jgi:hypothetical protein